MSLENQFNRLMQNVLGESHSFTIDFERLIRCIDLTLLDEQASQNQVDELQHQATRYEVAAICVHIQHLNLLPLPSDVKYATVVNFPHGTLDTETCFRQIDMALSLKAQEIDYVMPYKAYLAGDTQTAMRQCQTVIEYCQSNNLTTKIIMESGSFPEMSLIYKASQELSAMGCDFIKTSTGKIPEGASLAAAFAIASAIKDSASSCGIKLSGGIKTPFQAQQFASLVESVLARNIDKSWFRIGASSLLQELT